LQVLALNMEPGKHKFTIEALNIRY